MRGFVVLLALAASAPSIASAQNADTAHAHGEELRRRIEERFAQRVQEQLAGHSRLGSGTSGWRSPGSSGPGSRPTRTA
jgi:hypothetical protein